MPRSIAWPVCVILCGWAASAVGESNEDRWWEIGGLLFGDLYHVASHHTEEGDGATGAVLRRGYLTFNGTFGERWDSRLRIEVNQSGEFETYDFEAEFKDLWVRYRAGAEAKHDIHIGLSPTPTFDLIESFWGLRYLLRTPLDLQGVASRDTGFAGRGPLNASGTLRYRAMAGAGVEFGNESGDGDKLMGAVSWQPAPRWILDFYLDHEKLAGPADRTTWQVFTGYRTDTLRIGAQYSSQDRELEPPLELASVFAVQDLSKALSVIGRIDRLFEISPRGDNISYLPFDPRSRATFFIAALEWRATPKLRITPNITTTIYDRNDEGFKPDTDLHLRLTFFLDFE
jgi:hypothetical protein